MEDMDPMEGSSQFFLGREEEEEEEELSGVETSKSVV